MLNRIHQLSGVILLIYLMMHLSNHMLAVFGPDTHILWMERFRVVYRSLFFEVALLAAVMIQIASGLFFVIRGWDRRYVLRERAQVVSGFVLVLFFIFHLSDVMSARMSQAVDTNYWYIVAQLQQASYPSLLKLFYLAGITAFFVHLSCGVYWLLWRIEDASRRSWIAFSVVAVGLLVAMIIGLAFADVGDISLPLEYRES